MESIDKNLDDWETHYDIELTAKNGQEKLLTIADDGALLSAEVVLNETPDAVQKKIAVQLADGKMENIDENFDDDDTNYDIAFTTKDGREKVLPWKLTAVCPASRFLWTNFRHRRKEQSKTRSATEKFFALTNR